MKIRVIVMNVGNGVTAREVECDDVYASGSYLIIVHNDGNVRRYIPLTLKTIAWWQIIAPIMGEG